MENTLNTGDNGTNVPQEPLKPVVVEKKKEEEFSFVWHMKVLAVIYVILGILYAVLKFTLK
jgi:hypothetical protein